MPRIQYLTRAKSNLKDIAHYIAAESSLVVAQKFIGSLRAKCSNLASLPGTMGRDRPELGNGVRSFAYRGYVIFFRYVDDRFQIINILEGHRDQESHFEAENQSDA